MPKYTIMDHFLQYKPLESMVLPRTDWVADRSGLSFLLHKLLGSHSHSAPFESLQSYYLSVAVFKTLICVNFVESCTMLTPTGLSWRRREFPTVCASIFVA